MSQYASLGISGIMGPAHKLVGQASFITQAPG